MAQKNINIGTNANDGTGDPLRTAFDKINDNFTELFGDTAEANDILDDASPQLGGDLDLNGYKITTARSNENINVDLTDSKYSYHITEKGINKAKGFNYITNKYNINLDDCIAIGDSNTDIPLFDICGYSITMNHAESNVKEKVDFITKNNRAKGAIEAFKHVADKFLKKNIDDVEN